MRKKLSVILFSVLSFLSFVLAIKFYFFDNHTVTFAAVRIDSFPNANVIINDKVVGKTSYFSDNMTPGEYKIKLVPTGSILGTFTNWEAKVKLTEGTLTYISRNLGASSDGSSGQTLFLEKLATSDSKEVALVSSPDGATVSVDGQKEGKASIVLKNLSIGDHEIVLSYPGYSDEVIHGKIIGGYRLNIIVQLAQFTAQNMASPSAQSTAALVSSASGEIAKPYVVIKETGTGFLRVRSEPNLGASESARVKPGEKYPLLSEVTGWVKIKLPTIFGWVSDSYVEKVK